MFKTFKKSFLGVAIAIVGLFLIASEPALSVAGIGSSAISINCRPCNHWFKTCKCVETPSGTVYGHADGPVTISLVDLHFDATALVRNNVYVGNRNDTGDGGDDSTDNGGNGTAYINVPIGRDSATSKMLLFIEADSVLVYPVSELEWDLIKTKTYSELVGTIGYLTDSSNYISNIALVYPNPTAGTAFIKFNSDWASTVRSGQIIIRLFNSNDALINTFVANNFNNIIPIDGEYINMPGAYYLNCNLNVELNDGTLFSRVFTIPFIKIAGND